MAFFYPFINFLQPGILWPALADLRPMLVLSVIAAISVFAPRAGSQRPNYFTHPAFFWMLVYVAVQVCSVYYSGVGSMIAEFNAWYIYPLLVTISFLLIHDERSLLRYVWGMLAGGSVVIGYGLFHFLTRPARLAGSPQGAYGLYENHNDYTFIALTLLPFAWLLLREKNAFLARIFLGSLALGCMAAVFVSLSRGGILVLGLEVVMMIWLTMRGTRRIAVMLCVLAVAPVAIVHQFSARDEGRTNDYTVETAKSSRYELWTAAGRMIVRHPFLGVGSRRFQEYSSEYNEISHDNRGKVAHNTYLEIAAGSGLLGICSYFMMMWKALAPLLSSFSFSRLASSTRISSVRTAVLVAFVCIMVRAILDVKLFDWCVYTLLLLAVVVVRLASQPGENKTSAPVRTPRPRADMPTARSRGVLTPRSAVGPSLGNVRNARRESVRRK